MSSQMWIAFLLQDRFASDIEKENLKKDIMKKFNRNEEDICYIPYDINSGLTYYFFVKQYDSYNDLRQIWQSYIYTFEPLNNHIKITEIQFLDMMRHVKKYQHGVIKYGDLVLIEKGCYNKLYGIVLRQNRNGNYDIGLKFRFGTIVKSFSIDQIKVIDNIFKHIKVIN